MKILISPKIIETHVGQFEYVLDKKWFLFLSNIFGDIDLFLPEHNQKKIDLIILTGGNDLLKFKLDKKNSIRHKQDKKLFEYAVKKNIPLIGICYGAQFIAENLNCKLGKVKKHIGKHEIHIAKNKISFFKKNKKIFVNSFHEFGILQSSKNITILATATDDTIELFKANRSNCLGIMWHPERFSKIKKIDKEIFLNFYKQS